MKQFNLLPPSIARERRRRTTIRQIKVIAAGLVVIVAVYTSAVVVAIHLLNNRINTLKSVIAEAQKIQQQRSEQEAAYRSAQKTLALHQRLQTALSPVELLNVLSQAVPEQVYLESVKWETPPAQLPTAVNQPAGRSSGASTNSSFGDSTCRIQGIAHAEQNIAALMGALNDAGLFSELYLERSESAEVNGRPMRRFTIIATLQPNCRFVRVQLAGGDDAH